MSNNNDYIEINTPEEKCEEEKEIEQYSTKECSESENKKSDYLNQYSIAGDINFFPIGKTTKILPAGRYKTQYAQGKYYFHKLQINTTELIRFPNTVADMIISEFDKFWLLKEKYFERGETHKRGYLLWGPPGGGKTCLTSFIMQDFIQAGNIVFDFNENLIEGLELFRSIEPDRKTLILIEDIDSYLINKHLEQLLLQLLDGVHQFNNTIIIATTNYPEKLPDRLINRPSRFDRVEIIGLPTAEDRKLYLETKSKLLSKEDISKWIKDTKGFTLAHLKELLLAYEVYELDYSETLKRINKMRKKIEHSKEYTGDLRGDTEKAGFGV